MTNQIWWSNVLVICRNQLLCMMNTKSVVSQWDRSIYLPVFLPLSLFHTHTHTLRPRLDLCHRQLDHLMKLGFTTSRHGSHSSYVKKHWRFKEFRMNMVFCILTVWFWLMIMCTTTPSTNWPFEWKIKLIVSIVVLLLPSLSIESPEPPCVYYMSKCEVRIINSCNCNKRQQWVTPL